MREIDVAVAQLQKTRRVKMNLYEFIKKIRDQIGKNIRISTTVTIEIVLSKESSCPRANEVDDIYVVFSDTQATEKYPRIKFDLEVFPSEN